MFFQLLKTQFLVKRNAYMGCIISSALTILITNTQAQELIINGDFETGDLAGWTVITQPGSNDTNFFLSTPGTGTPLSGHETASNSSGGNFYVVTDQNGPGVTTLAQSFTIPPGVASVILNFQMFVNDQNELGPFIHPAGLNFDAIPNQHARVDILRAGAGPFDTGSAVLRNLYLGLDEGSNPHAYVDYSFDIIATVMKPGDYILRFAEVDNQLFFNQGVDNVSINAIVDDVSTVTSTCQVFGVQDSGLNDSQFFTVSGGNCGTIHEGYDIESIDIRPNQVLYGSSGRDTASGKEKGYLYKIDVAEGCQLVPVGDIKNETMDFDEVDSLSFNPKDNTLWGWARGEGLITIDADNGHATLELPSEIDIEALTWDSDGNLLYGAQGTTLWTYDGSSIVMHHCSLPRETEGLEMIRYSEFNEGKEFLLVGAHNDAGFNLMGINLDTCDTVIEMPVPYDDVEGISFDATTCPTSGVTGQAPSPDETGEIHSKIPKTTPKPYSVE